MTQDDQLQNQIRNDLWHAHRLIDKWKLRAEVAEKLATARGDECGRLYERFQTAATVAADARLEIDRLRAFLGPTACKRYDALRAKEGRGNAPF